MKVENIRYIVIQLNPDAQQYMSTGERIDTHDGDIFCSLNEAKEYALESIESNYCTRFAIGMFVMELQSERMSISILETFGFRNDKKNINQLAMFS